jgi:hypothetical protein
VKEQQSTPPPSHAGPAGLELPCVASTAGCSRRRHVPRKRGPKGPDQALIQAIVEPRNPRFGCLRIARIIAQTANSRPTRRRTSSLLLEDAAEPKKCPLLVILPTMMIENPLVSDDPIGPHLARGPSFWRWLVSARDADYYNKNASVWLQPLLNSGNRQSPPPTFSAVALPPQRS